MTRYYDFDAAASEPEPITLHLLGRDWILPGAVPAAPLLAYERLLIAVEERDRARAAGQTPPPIDIPGDFSVENLARQFAGDTVVDEWLALDIPYPVLQRTVSRLRRIHMGQDPGLGESQPPAKATRGAKAGPSPSPTSSPAGQR